MTQATSFRFRTPGGNARNGASDRPPLTVTRSSDGAIVVVGDLDVHGSETLDAALRRSDDESQAGPTAHAVVVDVGGVEFMDSSGLRVLVAASLRATSRNARVVLHGVGAELARLLEITGLADMFGVTGIRPDPSGPERGEPHR